MGRELVITRVFDMRRASDLVFKAWIDPKHVERWWGPKGFTNPVCELDARPGGAIRVDMKGPDGVVYPMGGVYREIVEPERLVFTTTSFEDEQGNPGLENLNTITFAEHNGKTKLTLHVVVIRATPEAAKALAGMEQGWTQSLERLDELVANAGREILASRVFDAPRELVWKAFTESERLMRWWGPKGFTMQVAKLDLRPGGVFHYCMRSPDGRDMWGKFVYREIVAPERIVFVNSFSDEVGSRVRHPMSPTWPLEVLNTMTLSEHDGRTTLTIRGAPINATDEERKTFQAGRESMKQGFTGTFDQLADYLAKG